MKVRSFWVDALCIEQKDDDENSKHIPLMAQDYRGCASVLVWLETSLHGASHMRQIALLTRQKSPWKEAAIATEQALEGLMSLPWFSPRWGLQEVLLNPNAILFCGNYSNP
ncbi:uncharacterized protein BCR38DRAFT_109547 [Pseudomassariella vexata]|uniref:Heterokaryon incompatibility domain-containing protein n=1 Tax=Pseudomassariella vexata TaxID=1141098 RepID=A0A1Y2DD89_9PEZI|nr:uncharacterized protein BCR38DRAFT_109547 [Pseudomassariella vexata]ORY57209.1 hypothetical protein BCR38DRAFT_109547 [Pseudomassariella vexata]